MIAGLIAGDNRAWIAFERGYKKRILKWLIELAKSPDDYGDILVEVFARVHRDIRNLKDRRKFVPWLNELTKNAAINYYKQRWNKTELVHIEHPERIASFVPASDALKCGDELRDSIDWIWMFLAKYREVLAFLDMEKRYLDGPRFERIEEMPIINLARTIPKKAWG